MMVTFVVAGDGSVSVKTQELQQDPPSGESRLPEIIDKLKDPRTPSAAIRRLALAELLVIAQEMAAEQRNMTPALKLKSYRSQLNILNYVNEALQKAAASSNEDALNIDGPKWQYLRGQFIETFEEAVEQAYGKGNETMKQKIMKEFHDRWAADQDRLRREVERIGGGGAPE